MNRADSAPDRLWLVVLSPLFAALLYAPLAFGATTPGAMVVLDVLLVLSALPWIGLLVAERRFPLLPVACLASLAVLGVLAACHLLNPQSTHESATWRLLPREGAVEWLPGTVDFDTSLPMARHLAALGLAFLVLLDGCRSHRRIAWWLLGGLAVSGFAVAILGIGQKAGGAEAMLWTTPEQSGPFFFGAFRYHANAASFLNLAWPAALALWLRSRATDGGDLASSLWFTVLFFVLAAVFANTSKVGQVLGLAGMVLAALRFRRLLSEPGWSRAVLAVCALLLAGAVVVVVLPGVSDSMGRWEGLVTKGDSLRGRLMVWGACLSAVPETGPFGTGPGTFHVVFPFHTTHLGERIAGVWYNPHQDYLQTLMEWGWVGFAAWAALFGEGIRRALGRVREVLRKGRLEISASCALLALGLVLLHALVDFPLQIPAIQLQVAVWLAVAWTGRRAHRDYRERKTPAGEAGVCSRAL